MLIDGHSWGHKKRIINCLEEDLTEDVGEIGKALVEHRT